MTKPHEETWRYDDDASVWIGDGPNSVMFFDGSPDAGTLERARLAAQAPAMARLLLTLEWAGLVSYVGDGGYRCCIACDGIAAGEETMPDARDDLAKGRTVIGHQPDCELVAVLRAAGVLP